MIPLSSTIYKSRTYLDYLVSMADPVLGEFAWHCPGNVNKTAS